MTKRKARVAVIRRTNDVELLNGISQQLNGIDKKLDSIRMEAAKTGAVAGGIAGGLVATGLAIIKARLGL